MAGAGPPRDVVQGEDRTAEGESLPFGAVQLLQRVSVTPAGPGAIDSELSVTVASWEEHYCVRCTTGSAPDLTVRPPVSVPITGEARPTNRRHSVSVPTCLKHDSPG